MKSIACVVIIIRKYTCRNPFPIPFGLNPTKKKFFSLYLTSILHERNRINEQITYTKGRKKNCFIVQELCNLLNYFYLQDEKSNVFIIYTCTRAMSKSKYKNTPIKFDIELFSKIVSVPVPVLKTFQLPFRLITILFGLLFD